MNHGVLMNKNTFDVVVSNGTMKVTTCATSATITEVESSLDDSSLHSHDDEEIMKPIVVVSKAKETIVSREENSNEKYFESEDEVAKEL